MRVALCLVCGTTTNPRYALAQRRARPVSQAVAQRRAHQTPTSADSVRISYPDQVDLGAFVDYVSATLNLKIIYGGELRNQSVVFRPSEVDMPKSQLIDLLRSMLRMHDLALVDGDVDGWLRIVEANDLQRHVARISDSGSELDQDSQKVVTQIIHLKIADMATVVKHIRGYLSSARATIMEIPERRLLVVTDYESAIHKAMAIVELLDQPVAPVEVVTLPLAHQPAQAIADRIAATLKGKAEFEHRTPTEVLVQPDPSGIGLFLIGTADAIAEVRELVTLFDKTPDSARQTSTYAPRHISARRIQQLIESVLAPDAVKDGQAQLFLDEESNRLYVTATRGLHERIADLLAREDVKTTEPSRPMRIYKPRNRSAQDLLGVLSEILSNVSITKTATDIPPPTDTSGVDYVGGKQPGVVEPGPTEPVEEKPVAREHVSRVEGRDYVMTHDAHTNSIIVIGPREFHMKFEALLSQLDRRQAQVVIEMTLVAITFNDSLSLAIELANEEMHGDLQSLFFSSFGISDIDLATGARTLSAGGGFNGIVLGPHETPFVIRAIAAHGDSRVIATPKLIVGDNITGTVTSVEEQPFTSINASNTVSTTSFAGFASAGTTLTVTPHIAEGDHLSLDYTLNFSNFTGSGSSGVPPPRTTNTFTGTVSVPDEYTVIVGGLVTENEADAVSEVPLLGRIPVLGAFFQSSERARTKSRIYAFIRASILRDDRFEDLKIISSSELERAALKARDFPESEPLWMR